MADVRLPDDSKFSSAVLHELLEEINELKMLCKHFVKCFI